MGLLTKQDIDNYYKNYKNNEVVFTKEVSSILGLQPKHIYIKFKEIQRPCIIYSSSMTQSKVIASLPDELVTRIKEENNVNLRFAINNEEKKNDLLFFFIKCRVTELTTYKAEQKLYLIKFIYLSKPPETLIALLGKLLEAKSFSTSRRDERIIIDKETMGKLGLETYTVQTFIDNIPRQGILRDISFGGVKLLLAGNAKFLNNKNLKIILNHKDHGKVMILGKSIRSESLPNRKDIAVLAIQLAVNQNPYEYNLLISDYLKSNKNRNTMEEVNTVSETK